MIKNYLLTAIRNLGRNKAFSAINIAGLALGLACSLLIFLWVQDERHMDKFNTTADELYSFYERTYTGGKVLAWYYTPGIMADEMKRVFPEVQYACGFAEFNTNTYTFQTSDKILKEQGTYASADFFNMFNYKLIEGNATNALNAPVKIAVSRKMADKLFGSPRQAMGKTIRFEDRKELQVAAVFEAPENSSMKFEFLINWHAFLDDNDGMKSWGNNGVTTFIKFRKGAHAASFEKKITHFLAKYDQFDPGFRVELGLQRFDEMYLHSNFNSAGDPEGGRIEYVRLFTVVAIFILLIACINFMNLTTARSVKRAKEIGIRKVVGAFRMALIAQFIGEALMLTFISMLVAMAMVMLIMPAFNMLTQKQIALPVSDVSFWTGMLAIVLVTGIVSGCYPAFFLSSFKPVSVLKGTLKLGNSNTLFRKGLVVFQFVLSIVLIIGTIVVARQINYIQTTNLGYNREHLLYIPQEGELNAKYNLFKEQALTLPGIYAISRIEQPPTDIKTSTWGIDWEGREANLKPTFGYARVGYDFTKTMNIQVLKGHDFRKGFSTDSTGYILNEEAAKQVGYKDPIGKPFTLWGRKSTIIGVVKNFHFSSLHKPVTAQVLFLAEGDRGGNILVKTQAGQTKQALAGLEKLCRQLNPKFPFTFQFVDDAYNNLYHSEQIVGRLSNCFALLAIFISCLGLLGLAMFTAEQRTKEIGIRKVLGAGTVTVFGLLSKDFLRLVLIALLIASPLAWYSMNSWLQQYAYRTNISWWMFAIAGLAAILIAFITISFQTIKAALANPIKSLRTE